MKVYKVVKKFDDILGSSVLSQVHDVTFFTEYAVGVKATPPKEFPDAWLLAFDSLQAAQHFIKSTLNVEGFAIYRALTSNAIQIRHLSCRFGDDILRNYWTTSSIDLMDTPPGSLFCKDITLLEEVT